jgi:hypothetical protein
MITNAVEFDAGDLREYLRGLKMATAGGKHATPLLKCGTLRANGSARFRATDLAQGVEIVAPEGTGDGSEWVASFDVAAALGVLKGTRKGSRVSISPGADGAGVLLSSGAVVSRVPGEPLADMPVWRELEAGAEPFAWTCAADLLAAFESVRAAVSTDRETRAGLCAVYIECVPEGLRLVASDSYRLHVATVTNAAHAVPDGEPAWVAMDAAGIPALMASLKRAGGQSVDLFRLKPEGGADGSPVGLRFCVGWGRPEAVTVRCPDTYRLASERVMHSEGLEALRVCPGELAAAAEGVGATSRADTGMILLSCEEGATVLDLRAWRVLGYGGPEGEPDATATAALLSPAPRGVDIALNERYIADALRAVGGDAVEFCYTGPLNPVYVLPVGAVKSGEMVGAGSSRVAVVMPMNRTR